MAPVGQAGQMVGGVLGDLIHGLDFVLQLQLAAAAPVNTSSRIRGLQENILFKEQNMLQSLSSAMADTYLNV